MHRSRLRRYVLLSILLHLLFGGFLVSLPLPETLPSPPVAIRVIDMPTQPPAVPMPSPPKPPERQLPKPPTKPGGVLAELPEPVRKERPDAARIVSRFDSRAQDVGPGPPAARKPTGQTPPQLPPELSLPERYSALRPNTSKSAPSLSTPQTPPASRPVSKQKAPPSTEPRAPNDTVPDGRQKVAPQAVKRPPDERQFRMTGEQEIAMLQQPNMAAEHARKEAMDEHFARLEKQLPLPTFDAPGVYDQGPEQPGEGRDTVGGGKYRSIDAYGMKHFSYLIGVKHKIELVFSIPFFTPNQGRIDVPIVGFTIRRNGELAEAVLLRSSGYRLVDQALLDAVKRAAPYGPFPQHLQDGEISIRVYATVS